MGTISRNFSYSEFEQSPLASAHGIDNTIPADVRKNVWSLVMTVLQPLRDKWGAALKINSGYRCEALNRLAGGVPTSQHTKGEAADIAASSPYKLAKAARDLRLPYDQMIIYPTFVHFSHRATGKQRGQILYNKSYKGQRL